MILFPYFSLKYDSTSLSHIGWLKGDLSEIVSSVDSIVNESRTITNNLQVYTTARSKYDLDRDNYNTQLDRIQYLRENLNMTVANPVVQNILQSLQLFPKCINDTFGTERWRQCNSDSQYNSTTPQLDLIFKSQFKLINESNTKITETAGRINSKITKIDEQIGKPGDIPSYKNIVENYLVISNNTHSTFGNVTSNLHPINVKTIYYASLAATPGLDLIRFKKIRNSLQELQDSIEGRNNEINSNIQKLASRFDQFESPLGKVPLGFNETIVAFPLLLAVGFFIYSFILWQVMRLRVDLYREYQVNDPLLKLKIEGFASFLAPIWIDPIRPKHRQLPQLLILFIPLALFSACFYIVIDVLFYLDDPNTSSDDIFSGANDINKIIFLVLNALGLVLVMYSYIRLFNDWNMYIRMYARS
jgi:hypothetical protein